MPLLSGTQNIKKNIIELTQGKIGSARSKAITTLAKKWGVSKEDAKFKQALIIARETAKKK